MISLSAPREGLATAFGVHRAMDTAGAMIGPLLAFGLLAIAPAAFDSIFLVSFCFASWAWRCWCCSSTTRSPGGHGRREGEGAAGVPARGGPATSHARASAAAAGAARHSAWPRSATGSSTCARGAPGLRASCSRCSTWARRCLHAARGPRGRLADRIGRARVFLAGYVLLLRVYGVLLLPPAGAMVLLAPHAARAVLRGHRRRADGDRQRDGRRRRCGAPGWPAGHATSLARLFASVLFGADLGAVRMETRDASSSASGWWPRCRRGRPVLRAQVEPACVSRRRRRPPGLRGHRRGVRGRRRGDVVIAGSSGDGRQPQGGRPRRPQARAPPRRRGLPDPATAASRPLGRIAWSSSSTRRSRRRVRGSASGLLRRPAAASACPERQLGGR